MVVEKVSVDRVKAKLALLSQKKGKAPTAVLPTRPSLADFAGNDDDEDDQLQASI